MTFQNPFREWNRDFRLLGAGMFSLGVYFGVRQTLFNNFIVDRLGIEAHQLGLIESLREFPGFLNVLFIALMIRMSPPVIAAASLVVMGLAIAAYSEISTVFQLGVFAVFGSLGFHSWLPMQQALGLAYSPPGNKGKWLGQLRSVTSASTLLMIGICLLVFPYLQYEGLFLLAAAAVIAGGLTISFASRPETHADQKSFVLRRRYWVYYALNVLQGVRRQMFITFAIFALVKVHGMPIRTTMILVLINQVLITVVSPTVGRLVDRLGERLMLSVSYVGLTMIFTGYALIQDRPTLYVLFCLDNLIFVGPIAMTTYIHKITPPEELRPTLSMGVTMNHVAAVIGPVVGGFVWQAFGYQVIFITGAVIAALSFVMSQWVDPEGLLAREKEQAQITGASAPLPDGGTL